MDDFAKMALPTSTKLQFPSGAGPAPQAPVPPAPTPAPTAQGQKPVILDIGGTRVQVDPSFLSLSPDEQNRTVDEIAKQINGGPTLPQQQAIAIADAKRKQASSPANDPYDLNRRMLAARQNLARQALKAGEAKAAPHPDPNYVPPQPPPGMVLNPQTGQVEDLRSPANPHIPTGTGNAAAVGAGEGIGFGSLDEAVGGLNAALGHGGTAGQRYDYGAGVMREAERRAEQDHPYVTTGAEIGGAIASPIGRVLGPAEAASTLPARVIDGIASGAAMGGAYGFNTGKGGLRSRMGNAKADAVYGGIGGAVIPPAITGTGILARKGVNMLASPFGGKVNATVAAQAVRAVLKRAGKTPEEINAALSAARNEGQPMYSIADATGPAGQGMLNGIARQPGDAKQQIIDYLNRRQANQGDRLSNFVATALDAPDTAMQRTASLKAARKAAADAAYEQARKEAGAVDVRGPLSVINDRIGPMQGSGVKGDNIDGLLAGFRDRLSAKNPASSSVGNTAPAAGDSGGYSAVHLSDFDRVLGVKQDVQDAIGKAVRAREDNKARELGKLQDALDKALEDASPAYRQANDNFAKASRVVDSVDKGATAVSGRNRAEDVANAFGTMTPEQQAAFKAGYADPIIAKIDSAAPGSNKARALLNDKAQADLAMMAPESPLARQIQREDEMFQTRHVATGGSQTETNRQDVLDAQGFGPTLVRVVTHPMSALGSAAGNIASRVVSAANGRNPATRAEIARMLLSQNLDSALRPAVTADAATLNREAVIGALMRRGMLPVAAH